jgi:hypothetical protein
LELSLSPFGLFLPTMARAAHVLLVVGLAALLAVSVVAFGPNPAITNLPGFGKTLEKQYAGYLPIRNDGSEDNALFYWLFESRGKPETDRTSALARSRENRFANSGHTSSRLTGFIRVTNGTCSIWNSKRVQHLFFSSMEDLDARL